MRGEDMDIVGEASVVTYPQDMNDGSYVVYFTLSWSGDYETYVYVNSEPYGNDNDRPFTFSGNYSTCPMDTPVKCPNKDMCVTKLTDCGIDQLSCVDESNPILCNVAD